MKFYNTSLGDVTKKAIIVDFSSKYCKYIIYQDPFPMECILKIKTPKEINIDELFKDIKNIVYSNKILSYCDHIIPDIILLFPVNFFSINEHSLKCKTFKDMPFKEIEKNAFKIIKINKNANPLTDLYISNKFFNQESGNLILQYYLLRIMNEKLEKINLNAIKNKITIIDIGQKSFYSHLCLKKETFKENIGFIKIDLDESYFAVIDSDLRKLNSDITGIGIHDSLSKNEKKLYIKNIIYTSIRFFKNNTNYFNLTKCVLHINEILYEEWIAYEFQKNLNLEIHLLKNIKDAVSDDDIINSYGYINRF